MERNETVWKPTYLYGEQYEISNTGKVRNCFTNKILSPQKDSKGYLRVRLSLHDKKATAKIHRLVAIAFIPNPYNKPQVNHINGNKEDNVVSNLEWVTNGENQVHAYRNGLNYATGRSGRRKIPVVQIGPDGNIVKRYSSIGEASRELKIARQNIEKVIKGERNKAGKYYWKKESEDGMKFKSNARYKEKLEDGSIFDLKDNSLKLSIHKYSGCGDNLYLSCYELGISQKDLETEDFNEAVSKSKEIVTERMKYLRDEAHKFIVDECIEIVRY